MKICVDCKHCHIPPFFVGSEPAVIEAFAICTHPSRTRPSKVVGYSNGSPCWLSRQVGECGVEGKQFEPAPKPVDN